MQKYLFRVEAVNLAPTVYDTSDISTIRGGGFYLLNRVSSLADSPDYSSCKITEGASSAVFRLELGGEDEAEERRRQILDDLFRPKKDSQPIREMMFMVEYVEESDAPEGFASDMAKLLGKIRLAQMQSPTVRIFEDTLKPGTIQEPGNDKKKSIMGYDEQNRILPAHCDAKDKGKISFFTEARRKQGVKLRKDLYKRLIGDIYKPIEKYEFTDDLKALCEDDKAGNLNGKMAYIYIDGNKFGGLQRSFSEAQLRQYDYKLQGFKQKFLAEVIKLSERRPAFKKDYRTIRLETLLWGGDEIKMIVPACMGWEVASCFFRVADDPEMKMARALPDGTQEICDLTYAMGLVFAQHKNPIRNVDEIAAGLADCVKEELKEEGKKLPEGARKPVYDRARGDRMHYMVLESLETLPTGYGEFAGKYYNTVSEAAALCPGDMDRLRRLARDLNKIGFPKSRIHSMALAKAKGDDAEYEGFLEKGFDSCETGEADQEGIRCRIEELTKLETAGRHTGGALQRPLFTQMAELWDYVAQDYLAKEN